MRVCKEWGSLLLNEEVKVVCEDRGATDWINGFFSSTNFMNAAQDMAEVGVTMSSWEYRMRWYGEEESVARARAAEIGTKAQ